VNNQTPTKIVNKSEEPSPSLDHQRLPVKLEDPGEVNKTKVRATKRSTTSLGLTRREMRLPWNNPRFVENTAGKFADTPRAMAASIQANSKKMRNTLSKPSSGIKLRRKTGKTIRESLMESFKKQETSHRKYQEPSSLTPKSNMKRRKVETCIPASRAKPPATSELGKVLNDDPECLGAVQYGVQLTTDINICTLNVNSLSDDKFTCILAAMEHQGMDVAVLTDTRHRESSAKKYTNRVKEALGPLAKCLHAPIAPHKNRKGGYQGSVGGQMIIISPTWAGALSTHFTDPSKLGLISGITYRVGREIYL
jgi:hypothetical protein